MPMNYEEAAQHVGDAVIYTRPGALGEPQLRTRGVIQAMKQMPLVKFDDGSLLQVNPHCLELEPNTGGPASLGYGEWNRSPEGLF